MQCLPFHFPDSFSVNVLSLLGFGSGVSEISGKLAVSLSLFLSSADSIKSKLFAQERELPGSGLTGVIWARGEQFSMPDLWLDLNY